MSLVQSMNDDENMINQDYSNLKYGDYESKQSEMPMKTEKSHDRVISSSDKKVWASLSRNNEGSEKNPAIPQILNLKDEEVYIGRLAAVDGKSKKSSTHEKQVMIPCPFVSGTHFSIRRQPYDYDTMKFFIKDYSRNGIYVNGILVGNEKEVELADGDKIAFIFHGDMKICYEFHVMEYPIITSSPQRFKGDKLKENIMTENPMNDVFINQLSTLKEEKMMLENRLNDVTSQLEEMTKENNNLQRENKTMNQSLSDKESDINNLHQEVSDLVAHQSANEARIRNLMDELEEYKSSTIEMKSKLSLMNQDLEYKSQLATSRESMVEEMNRELLQEKNAHMMLEGEISRLERELYELKYDHNKSLQAQTQSSSQMELLEGRLAHCQEMNVKLLNEMKEFRESTSMKIKEVNNMLSHHMQSVSTVLFTIEEHIDNSITDYEKSDHQPPSTSPVPPAVDNDGSIDHVPSTSQAMDVDMSMTQLSSNHIPTIFTPARKTTRFDDEVVNIEHDTMNMNAGDSQSSSVRDDHEMKRMRMSPIQESSSSMDPMHIVAGYSEAQLPLNIKSQELADDEDTRDLSYDDKAHDMSAPVESIRVASDDADGISQPIEHPSDTMAESGSNSIPDTHAEEELIEYAVERNRDQASPYPQSSAGESSSPQSGGWPSSTPTFGLTHPSEQELYSPSPTGA